MRLTPDVIQESSCFLNPLGDRELDLRGLKIPELENLGVTKDLNDTLDLSDNDLRQLHNFPLLRRLKHILASNNRITSIDPLKSKLPNLTTLILTNNLIATLDSLEPLLGLNKLTRLSLINNPVTKIQDYRLWCIFRFPSLRFLDFTRVLDKERQAAKLLFVAPDGELTTLATSILSKAPSKTFDAGDSTSTKASSVSQTQALQSLPLEEQRRIQASLAKASSLV